uniref:[histone H3]-lysine(4) N-trimethyltransferase n=1 Tax=Anthurium amnicola TaxID=1678845 RepID=A0A1D1YQH8_9ARAE
MNLANKFCCFAGKSRIHGFGVFAKLAHKAGDMVIEYTGELVRPPIADIREHLIYNSLVGAGTYMFRIDDERVIDATKAGSIAQLINHSCEPNCYSRVISVNGDEHIIIFAKRDIKQWEELTYDYRFFSIDEQLTCYCGFQRCRGVVNDVEAEERVAKIWVSRSELISWGGE